MSGRVLIEDEEIEARALGEIHAGPHLLAPCRDCRTSSEVRSDEPQHRSRK